MLQPLSRSLAVPIWKLQILSVAYDYDVDGCDNAAATSVIVLTLRQGDVTVFGYGHQGSSNCWWR